VKESVDETVKKGTPLMGLVRPANSQLGHRAIPRVLKRVFLFDEMVDLRLQRKVAPGLQMVHPLACESM